MVDSANLTTKHGGKRSKKKLERENSLKLLSVKVRNVRNNVLRCLDNVYVFKLLFSPGHKLTVGKDDISTPLRPRGMRAANQRELSMKDLKGSERI